MNKNINDVTRFLFARDFSDSLTDDQEDVLLDQVDQQISEFGWDETYASWKHFLLNECKTAESVINFANLFWWYGGQDHPIPDPHQFLGYFYYRIDSDIEKYDATDILDSLATNILSKAGYREANLTRNPYYAPENDPKIIAAANRYKS